MRSVVYAHPGDSSSRAARLPQGVGFDIGASLGVPATTATER